MIMIVKNGISYEHSHHNQALPLAVDVENSVKDQIALARSDTRQLQDLITRVKAKVRDANLAQMSKNVPSLRGGSVNLASHLTLNGHNNKISDFAWSSDSQILS